MGKYTPLEGIGPIARDIVEGRVAPFKADATEPITVERYNGSGVDMAVGDVVTLLADGTIELADVAQDTYLLGVCVDTIADGELGQVQYRGPCPRINVTASVTARHFGEATTTPGRATGNATRQEGSFLQFTSGGTTPSGFLFGGAPDTGSGGGGTGGTTLLLDYALAADHSNQALSTGTPFDLFANQNFTVAGTGSVIEVAVRGYGFSNDAVVNQYVLAVVIDSAGTPVTKYISGASNNSILLANRHNLLAGNTVYVTGLSAATHTVKAQLTATVGADHFYCRASTNGPLTGAEFLTVQVIEHLN